MISRGVGLIISFGVSGEIQRKFERLAILLMTRVEQLWPFKGVTELFEDKVYIQ